MKVRVRLAPSPTGTLHIGTARTALFNWLYATNNNGNFLLRIEDTDLNRSSDQFTKNIIEGLQWLGINWDEEPVIQSKNIEKHCDAIRSLIERGLAYRCYVNEEELESIREDQKNKGLPPRYDNRHRNLTKKEEEFYISEGRDCVIRFRIENDTLISWNDLIRGPITWNSNDLGGDMVIARRSDHSEIGAPLYNLAVVIDDNAMRISHVIRGEDHISNTAKQILLYQALGFNVPKFAHSPLILNSNGKKLSKRDGVTSIDEFKSMGYIPEALANYMALLGWSVKEGMDEIFSLKEAAEVFTLNRINKAGAKFDWDKLNWINSQFIHNMPTEKLLDSLIPLWKGVGWKSFDREWALDLVNLIAPSMTFLTDGISQSRVFFEDYQLEPNAIEQLKNKGAKESLLVLTKLIKLSKWNGRDIDEGKNLINEASKEADVKKGLIMKSLRAALLGSMQGPDLMGSWSLLARINLDIKRLEKCIQDF